MRSITSGNAVNARNRFGKNFIFSVLAVVLLWLLWFVAYFIVGNDYVLPSVGSTFAAMGRILASASFWNAFGGTLLRTLWAFLASLICGVALALFARLFDCVRAVFAPLVSILRTVPTMAVILVLLLWTSPAVAPVVVGVLVLLPAVYAAALSAFDGVEEEYGELVRAFRVGRARKVFRMYLPLAAPPVLQQAGGIFSMGLKIVVSGEVLSSTYRSLGGMMQEAKMFVQMPDLLALTLVTVLLGFALEGLCAVAVRLSVRWKA